MAGGQAFAVAGGQAFGVAYLLDGATHNNPYDNLNLPLPFPDALQEFRLETSTTNANNGMHSGASVNVVTKAGTETDDTGGDSRGAVHVLYLTGANTAPVFTSPAQVSVPENSTNVQLVTAIDADGQPVPVKVFRSSGNSPRRALP
jgi:hypothetical protein